MIRFSKDMRVRNKKMFVCTHRRSSSLAIRRGREVGNPEHPAREWEPSSDPTVHLINLRKIKEKRLKKRLKSCQTCGLIVDFDEIIKI